MAAYGCEGEIQLKTRTQKNPSEKVFVETIIKHHCLLVWKKTSIAYTRDVFIYF